MKQMVLALCLVLAAPVAWAQLNGALPHFDKPCGGGQCGGVRPHASQNPARRRILLPTKNVRRSPRSRGARMRSRCVFTTREFGT